MKSYVCILGLGLSLSIGACKGGAPSEPGAGAATSVEPQITETEYSEAETRARVLLKVAPGSTVVATSHVGRWSFERMVTEETGGAQFNVVLTTRPSPGDELVLAFDVIKDGVTKTIEAKIRVPGEKPLDLKLGFAASEPGDGKARIGCGVGALNKGEGKDTKNVATFCMGESRTDYYFAKGETKARIEALSSTLSSITIGGVKADFVDGKAELAIDPTDALARSPIMAMVGYEGQISLGLSAEGPGGPFWGQLPLTTGGGSAHGWMLAVQRGPSLLEGERKRAARKGLLAAVRTNDATGGLLWGLFSNTGKIENNYRIKAQEVDLVAIDSGTSTVVGTCNYERSTDGAKANRDQINIGSNVTIYDRKTGAKIASKAFSPGKHPGCSSEIQTGDGNFVNKADVFEIEQWAKSFVTDDFVPGYDDAEDAPADAPKVDGLASNLAQVARISKGYLGLAHGMTPARVEAIMGAGTLDSQTDTSRFYKYLDGGVHMNFAVPGDVLEMVVVLNQEARDALAAKGISDPVLDLFNQPLEVATKLLNKPTKSDGNSHEWSLQQDKFLSIVGLDFFDGRCSAITVTWLVTQ